MDSLSVWTSLRFVSLGLSFCFREEECDLSSGRTVRDPSAGTDGEAPDAFGSSAVSFFRQSGTWSVARQETSALLSGWRV